MTKKNVIRSFKIIALTLLLQGCKSDDDTTIPQTSTEEIVAVANRASESVSFVDANTNLVLSTLTITGSEPMYVVYVPNRDRIYVGDRAENKVYVIDPKTRTVETSIAVGNGVFHMWPNGQGSQLWVNNDVDNTVSVIDLVNNTVIQTIDVGSKPHDVFVTKDGSKAYVSIINPTTADQIYMYSTSTFAKTGEATVGEDPHVFHIATGNKLFVPCQSGQVYALNGTDLTEITNEAYTGAHGIFSAPDDGNIYVANIVDAQLYSINASTSMPNTTALDVVDAKPHNLTVNENGDKLFVTHSGPTANKLSTYTINSGTLTAQTTIDIGTNPFGLAYYKRTVN